MNARIAKLESLLSLVQERAAAPRIETRALAADEIEAIVASDRAEDIDVDDLDFDEPEAADFAASVPQMSELDEPDLDVPVSFDEEEVDDLDELSKPESGAISNESIEKAIQEDAAAAPLTPPPESGAGFTRPQLVKDEGPTMAQLGETISLEEGKPQDFELDEPDFDDDVEEATVQINKSQIASLRLSSSDPLEAKLPSAPALPSDEPLQSPPGAKEELERLALGEATPIEARVSRRPAVSATAVELISASRSFAPKSFAELLDASIALK